MEEPLLGKEDSHSTSTDDRDADQNKQVSVLKLFQFASNVDILMIATGILSSTIAGMSFPLIMVVIGLVITQFTDYTVAEMIFTASSNISNTSNITFDYFCPSAIDQGFVDYIRSSDPKGKLKNEVLHLTFGMLGIGSGYFVSTFIAVIMWSVSSINQEGRIKINFIKSVLNQDISHYDSHPPTELPSLLTDDIKKIGIGLGVQWDSVISQLSSIVSGFIIALYFNWKLTLAISAFIPPLLVLLVVLGKFIASVTSKEQTILSSAGSLAEQILFSVKTVMAFGGQVTEWKRYDKLLHKAHRHSYLKSIITGTVFAIYNLVLFLIFSIGFWYGGKLFVGCGVEVGDVIIVIFEVSVVTLAFGYLVLPLTAIGVAIGSATNVFAVIKKESKMTEHQARGTAIENFEGNIQINGILFSYPSRPYVLILAGIDLHIKPGQSVALVGPSGCGKSTIIKLLQRIYDFSAGSILLDGQDIKQLDIQWLRSQIGVVSQEPVLFNVTVAENIGYGKDGATRMEIEAAARAANAHEFISNLPNGYSTLVGEGGSQMSGGQKQRIAIARALIRDPKVLFLDEATSALDTESERAVQESLDQAQLNRTTIMIAHRLSTVKSADLIVAIDKGRIVEMGSHDELLANRNLYYNLVMEQSIGDNNEQKSYRGPAARYSNAKSRSFAYSRPSSRSFSSINPLQFYSRSRAITLDANQFPDQYYRHHVTDEKVTDPIAMEYIFLDKSLVDVDDMNAIAVGSKKPSFKQLLILAKDDWWMIALGTLSFCFIGLELSALYILMSESLKVFARRDANSVTNGLLLYIYLYAGLGVLGFVLHILGTICLGVAADRFTKRIRSRCFQSILKQDPSFFDKQDNSVSALVSMLAIDATNINQITGIPVGFAVRVLCSAIASTVISLQSSWVLSCVLLPSYVVLCTSAILQVHIGRVICNRTSHILEGAYRTAIEAIENVYTVSSLGVSAKFVNKCRDQFAQTTRLTKTNTILFGSLYAFSQSFIYFATSAAIIIGAIIFTTDRTSPFHADLIDIFQSIMSVVFTSVLFNDAFHALPDTEQAKLSARRVTRLLTQHPIISAISDAGITPDTSSGLIEINACKFSYPSRPDVSILNGVDVCVKPGQTLAIVGPSGSGKSTVAALIERFYDPTAGVILLDGRDIRDLNISWLRQQIALVSQEPVLFDMSVADNIRYGANFTDISDDEVHNAAKLANIHEFISSLPKGYSTNVGLKGTQLSGGQKQRVAIARALIRNPKILLLDEATSALDTESEKIVQDALDQARVGRTTIVIAHRLSTIYNSDMIVVLQKGEVVEQGKHNELMEKEGTYYAMNTTQQADCLGVCDVICDR